MKQLSILFIFVALGGQLLFCGPSEKTLELQKKAKANFGLLPDKSPGSENDTQERIALGKKLYFDTILSENKTQSCNSCHNIEGKAGGVDNLPTSPGAFGKNGDRNSPTVLNASLHFVQFWDGRAKDLKEQAKGPILNPVEMAMPNEKEVISRLSQDEEYPGLFAKAFPKEKNALTYDNLAESIAAFERTLITKDRLNDFVSGDHRAINSDEQAGLEAFIANGCTSCHNGVALGGNSFRKVGQVHPYKTDDMGRYAVTKKEDDKFLFKVPSLRNIAITGPYFHDGSVKTLEEAVKLMAYHQLGKELDDKEVESIVKFLGTLTDKERL
ncbi:cytochrome-c peroxidase [Leptospira sp. GIMC2001]|uniref:cytochrome-c peroxidase n=1 Tax=Leptospira sp. GIMC2001 TaxID=1513297 RepID=UPI002349BC4C|nr:cytochrome-c peroxidase [Leptospira sp. GIMC2001]WCL51390.1 cytochrome-c peroxidase [Leptospira sp. GIMC2001]